MPVHLEGKDLINAQQMEVAVNGPDGATHLILCTGIAEIGASISESYVFFVGPPISRRQFVGVIASGGLSTIQGRGKNGNPRNADVPARANLVLVNADYDVEAGQVRVTVRIGPGIGIAKLAIGYQVSILAELPRF